MRKLQVHECSGCHDENFIKTSVRSCQVTFCGSCTDPGPYTMPWECLEEDDVVQVKLIWLLLKKWHQFWGPLNGNKDQNLRNPSSLILSHTHLGTSHAQSTCSPSLHLDETSALYADQVAFVTSADILWGILSQGTREGAGLAMSSVPSSQHVASLSR